MRTKLSIDPEGTAVLITYYLNSGEFQCKTCKRIHKRSAWSCAHNDTPHTFTCECGYNIDIVKDIYEED